MSPVASGPRAMLPGAGGGRLVLLGTPMTLGLARLRPRRVPGVAGLAAALRAAGLVEALGAVDLGDVPAPTRYRQARDPRTLVRNLRPVVAHTRRLADALAGPLGRGDLPLLLGGDCSVLLGALLALRRRGHYGLLALDGHTDFYPAECSASGQVAAMELWIAIGGAPTALADIDGLRPLVRPQDAILLGYRDHAERRRSGAPDPADHLLRAVPCEAVQRGRAGRVAEAALQALAGHDLDGIWLHCDVDVLDDAVMPAVDTREPGGLTHGELVAILSRARRSGVLAGLSVTIFDPTLDADGSLARTLVAALRAGLAGGVRGRTGAAAAGRRRPDRR